MRKGLSSPEWFGKRLDDGKLLPAERIVKRNGFPESAKKALLYDSGLVEKLEDKLEESQGSSLNHIARDYFANLGCSNEQADLAAYVVENHPKNVGRYGNTVSSMDPEDGGSIGCLIGAGTAVATIVGAGAIEYFGGNPMEALIQGGVAVFALPMAYWIIGGLSAEGTGE